MKTCPVCQKLVNDETKFCYYCGASLLTPAAQPAPEPAPMPEPEPIAAPEPEPAPIPEPVRAPEPQPEPEPVAAPEPQPEPEPIRAPEPQPEPEPVAAPEPAPAPIPEPVRAPEPAPAPIHEPVKAPEPAPVVPPTSAPEPEKNGVIVNATDSRSLMTTAGYIFTTILFHIPVIGLIFMFVWGCGRPKNLSRKRFALACLLMRLIGVILVLSIAVFLLICYSDKFPILTDAFTRFFA